MMAQEWEAELIRNAGNLNASSFASGLGHPLLIVPSRFGAQVTIFGRSGRSSEGKMRNGRRAECGTIVEMPHGRLRIGHGAKWAETLVSPMLLGEPERITLTWP